jgi:uncharacterized alpha-E superfamily protein
VLDLLLADATNPRALAFQLAALADRLAQLPQDPGAPSPTHAQNLIARASAALAAADFDALSEPGADAAFDHLEALFDEIEQDLRGVSDTVTFHYFSHAEQHVR